MFTRMTAGLDGLDAAWMQAGRWPKQMRSTANRLGRIHLAGHAREKGRELDVWYGPEVPLAPRRPKL